MIHENIIKTNIVNIVSKKQHHTLYQNEIKLRETNSIEFYLSMLFNQIKINNSNLQFILKEKVRDKELLNFENNHSQSPFHLHNFNICHLFTKVDASLIVDMLACLLHERSLIIINDDPKTYTYLVQTLFDLMYPLKHRCSLYTYLQPAQIDLIDEPSAYIVGVS